MKQCQLDIEEKMVLRDFESGMAKPVKNVAKAKKLYQRYVREYFVFLARKHPKA